MNAPAITTYNAQYLPAFVALNREWIEKHFKLEPMDLAQLENPDESILKKGGEIFFVIENGIAVGTCAMVPHGEATFELAKMAVSLNVRGKGYGDLVMQAALEWARKKKAKKVTLLSNKILTPAISLYKKHGFKTIGEGTNPDYSRCNIEMELVLT